MTCTLAEQLAALQKELENLPEESIHTEDSLVPINSSRLEMILNEFIWFLEDHDISEVNTDKLRVFVYECDCGRCKKCKKSLPHFYCRPMNLKIDWYKRPGRGFEGTYAPNEREMLQLKQILLDFQKSVVEGKHRPAVKLRKKL